MWNFITLSKAVDKCTQRSDLCWPLGDEGSQKTAFDGLLRASAEIQTDFRVFDRKRAERFRWALAFVEYSKSFATQQRRLIDHSFQQAVFFLIWRYIVFNKLFSSWFEDTSYLTGLPLKVYCSFVQKNINQGQRFAYWGRYCSEQAYEWHLVFLPFLLAVHEGGLDFFVG